MSLALLGAVPAIVAGADVVQLNDNNFEAEISKYEVVMVNFYADWCRFCQMLKPVWQDAADSLASNARVKLARVDCEAADTTRIKTSNHVSKYPTIKIFRRGHALKQEYRGQRSKEAFGQFATELIADPVLRVETDEAVDAQVNRFHKGIVGEFPSQQDPMYMVFHTVAVAMRDNCHFVAKITTGGSAESKVFFKSHGEVMPYKGAMNDQGAMQQFVKEQCNPLVREITFENGEELTEEGLPFLIMFYDPEHLESVRLYKHVIKMRFAKQAETINFITANGVQFAHPLKHLGKTRADLPVLALDTFRHMYLYKHFKSIAKVGRLEKFIADFYSGALHQNFHAPANAIDGPEEELGFDPYSEDYLNDDSPKTLADKLEEAKEAKQEMQKAEKIHNDIEKKDEKELERKRREAPHIDHEVDGDDPSRPVPIKSVLKKLKPSQNRYSFKKDEL